ncbi:hypothetical protein LMH73_027890 [Vibrio splendidus]
MNRVSKGAFIALSASVMGGCATHKIDANADTVDAALVDTKTIKNQGETLSRTAMTSVVKNEFFLATTPYKMTNAENLPAFFQEKIRFNQIEPVSAHELLNHLTAETGIRVNLTADAVDWIADSGVTHLEIEKEEKEKAKAAEQAQAQAEGKQPWPTGKDEDPTEPVLEVANYAGSGLRLTEEVFSFTFDGTIEQSLDRLTQKLNLFWKWEDGKVEIYRHEVRQYIFDGANTTVGFESSITTNTESSGESSGGSVSSGHETSYGTTNPPMFDELKEGMSNLLSEAGTLDININTGVITVNDVPSVHKSVEMFIDKMNSIVNKRIMIKTEIIEVVSDDSGDYGFDLNAVYTGSSKFNFKFNPLDTNAAGGNFEFGIIDGNSNWNGSKGFVSALNTMAKNTTKQSSTVTTQNGQPVPVQIIDRKNYVEKVTYEEDEDGNKTFDLITNRVQPGYSMTVIPKLTSKGSISMQFALDLKKLNSMNEFKVGDVQATLPDETQKSFMQNIAIKNGQTLMMTGFESDYFDSTVKSLGGEESWFFGGSKKGGQKKVMTIILLTPYLLAN